MADKKNLTPEEQLDLIEQFLTSPAIRAEAEQLMIDFYDTHEFVFKGDNTDEISAGSTVPDLVMDPETMGLAEWENVAMFPEKFPDLSLDDAPDDVREFLMEEGAL